ncbi:flavodoxin domain-containing protein [Petrocella sp. FN5]|uniref:flavodoxin domain-containing protein n=1 Tax=Petrocella sp. FN5 TaxID=3032002 RepID=UPI0023DA97BF|nr:flavodoxin domain-containing protein [Petrocella sp. FN5]MDF1616910.1 flavodoxin domain-containing protein [Petrocella sp. FN5]
MKTQVLYATMTGHSKKIAHAIAKNLDTKAHDLKDDPIIPNCDLLLIVSGIYSGEAKPELLNYVKNLSPTLIKKVALITSSTRNSAQGSLRQTLVDTGINVEPEEYLCQGGFLFKAMGHPNKDEIEGAVVFAQKLVKEPVLS